MSSASTASHSFGSLGVRRPTLRIRAGRRSLRLRTALGPAQVPGEGGPGLIRSRPWRAVPRMVAMAVRLHADQVDVDVSVAQRLVAEQFPQWAGLPVRPVSSGGTDNAVFRLGGQLALRMPMRASAVEGIGKEVRWLPLIAAHVTLEVPAVVAEGVPGAGYPFAWTVVRWLTGQDVLTAPPA